MRASAKRPWLSMSAKAHKILAFAMKRRCSSCASPRKKFGYQFATPMARRQRPRSWSLTPQGHVYPNPARRLAPDFFFHSQVYRHDGESIDLPPGHFSITATRGPEYLVYKTEVDVTSDAAPSSIAIKLQRWIDPTQRRWISGDHHVHAAGCAHYEQPTEGVKPSDMMRHILVKI